jgi:hypothetical protein
VDLNRPGGRGPPASQPQPDRLNALHGGVHRGCGTDQVEAGHPDDGNFTGLDAEKAPIVGANDGTGVFTIPQRPIRRRLQQLPRFVITKGGEYLFMPGIRALNWIGELEG